MIEREECDFVKDIAARLPLEIICEMAGVPPSQEQFVFDCTNKILGLGAPNSRQRAATRSRPPSGQGSSWRS